MLRIHATPSLKEFDIFVFYETQEVWKEIKGKRI